MVLLKGRYGQAEYILRSYLIIPHFLQQSSFIAKDVLMRNAMRRVEPPNRNPFALN
jgi:hypothetical protein